MPAAAGTDADGTTAGTTGARGTGKPAADSRRPNAVRFVSADGFEATYPLAWLLERHALIADQVGGEPLSESFGGMNQLWIEGAAARVFVRDIVRIEFCTVEDPRPPSFEADDMLFRNRPNAGVLPVDAGAGLAGTSYLPVGHPIDFEGYAYDFDRAVAAVEFSLDQGATWTRQDTPGATAGRLVWWRFAYTPTARGSYELLVRAVSENGAVSPEPARCGFEVA